ncbi:MAG: ComEC/Rec2 family competence protein [Candidatus Omnitrophota bacterium]
MCLIVGIISFIFTFIFLNKSKIFIIFLLLGFFFLGIITLSNRIILPKNHIKNFKELQYAPVQISGTVIDEPLIRQAKINFKLQVRRICKDNLCLKATGKILVLADKPIKEKISFSDIILFKTKPAKPYSFADKKDFNYRSFLAKQDIYFICRIREGEEIEIIGQDSNFKVLKIINDSSRRLNELLFFYLPDLSATFYSAIILGIRGADFIDLSDIFVKTGTAHILAISGLHVGIVVFVFLLFLKAIGVKQKLRFIICILGLIFYCLLTGMRPSVLRASLMAIFLLVGFLIEREGTIFNSLALAALLILLFEPRFLFDVGFQLSFMSVLGIIVLTPCFIKSFQPTLKASAATKLSCILKFFIYAFFVSTTAWLATAPLIMYYFKIITPIAIFANIIIVPSLTIIVGLGFALLFSATIFPALANIVAKVAAIAASLIIHIVSFLSRIPLAYFSLNFKISPLEIIIYYILLVSFAYYLIGCHKNRSSL